MGNYVLWMLIVSVFELTSRTSFINLISVYLKTVQKGVSSLQMHP